MKKIFTLIVLLIILLLTSVSILSEPLYHFESKHQNNLYQELTHSTRCLVCQNQNIADSNSRFSVALKAKLSEMIKAGKSKKQIEALLINHYGEKVLFSPARDWRTSLLWYGPFVLLLGLPFFYFRRYFRRRRMKP